jgi:hypothetical protein
MRHVFEEAVIAGATVVSFDTVGSSLDAVSTN